MVPLDDDADLALIANLEVVDKVMDAKTKGDDVGIRARMLLDRWALARGAELTRQEDAPAHISRPECDRCRRTPHKDPVVAFDISLPEMPSIGATELILLLFCIHMMMMMTMITNIIPY